MTGYNKDGAGQPRPFVCRSSVFDVALFLDVDRAMLDLHIGARDIFADDAEREQNKAAQGKHDRQKRRIARYGFPQIKAITTRMTM